MAKSQTSYNKKEKEKKRLKKRKDKLQKKEERKLNPKSSGLDDMIAYVDEHGNITDTPPDPSTKTKVNAESIEVSVPKKVKEDIDPIHFGRLDFFNDRTGYGFIEEIGTKERYFVHINSMLEPIALNDTVTFELERGMKGMNAVRVKKT
jgi:cold shock CspA family protein